MFYNKKICLGLYAFRRWQYFLSPFVSKTQVSQSQFHSEKISELKVLGIETSCDDTGAAVINEHGKVLGEALHSQTSITVSLGGIVPPHAKALHKANIENVVNSALKQARLEVKDLDAIAVTVEPGLALCLEVGLSYAKWLVQEYGVPMIAIHHMHAHALTARMIERVDFPFLVLLASGGHCLLALAKDVDDFLILGTSVDGSPGECYDKVARRMKLKNLSECAGLSGGRMIENLALTGDLMKLPAPNVMSAQHSCNFSFSGLKSFYIQLIEEEEENQGIVASHLISNAADVCAAFQYAILKHLARSVQRAFEYCEITGLLPDNKALVFSGGVASNSFLRAGIQKVCDMYGSRLVCPPPHLCTDNGIMIAWNGMEKLLSGREFVKDPQSIYFTAKSPMGKDVSSEVENMSLKLPKIKLV